MKVIKGYPPNYKQIKERFPYVTGRPGILFSWGDILWNPSGVKVVPWIMAHEEVHGSRQEGKLYEWWESYLTTDSFRLKEEVLAHRAEWQAFKNAGPDLLTEETRLYLNAIAKRLSSPLYGSLVSYHEALDLILES